MYHKTYWTAEKVANRLKVVESLVYRRREALDCFKYRRLEKTALAAPLDKPSEEGQWETLAWNSHWAGVGTDFVLSTGFVVPDAWAGQGEVALYLPLGEAHDFSHPEALIYIDGEAIAACDREHQEVRLPGRYVDGKRHVLHLHGWTGRVPDRKPRGQLFLRTCELVQVDEGTRGFLATSRMALETVKQLNENDPAQRRMLNALHDAFLALETCEPLGEGFYDSVAGAHGLLREGLKQAGPALDVDVVAAGHAHIDVAWLWPLAQTRLKSGRTFHTVTHLMEQYPEMLFAQSQPQLYDFVRKDYPALFEKIRDRAAEGQWELLGGMWVEADCNLSGAESLARQFLLGRRFFAEHFGKDADSPVLFLPDVFGYAWNLPQLIKQAGLEYFFTTKISWNQYNRLPYDSFWWQGLDGTQVLTHFGTTAATGKETWWTTYNGMANPSEIFGTWRNYSHKEAHSELLTTYGFGDGGGGPTREMCENIRELGDMPSCPRVRHGSVKAFFEKLADQAGDRLPIWNGELYLELHRGTYTTQGRTKWNNRRSEFALHDAEFLAVLAGLVDGGFEYPKASLGRAWELVCLNQFHDIIPGSSIGEVYADAAEQYAEVAKIAGDVCEEALAVIGGAGGGDLAVVNPIGFGRGDLAFWDETLEAGTHLVTTDGREVVSQGCEGGTWIDLGDVGALSLVGVNIAAGKGAQVASSLQVSKTLLENDYLRVELDARGDIVRVYDKVRSREVLAEGTVGNQFQAFEDRPMRFDAWDIDSYYEDKMWLSEEAVSVTVVESGPLRGTLEIRRRILGSEYTQRISLSHKGRQLDFATTINWQERHVLLKVAFEVTVLAPAATYEIQWGHVERATHRNTSWDWARFETCAQKWVDLSEDDYGVSLLNDCKYGHDIRDNVMRITLLRSPTEPDPEADRGVHTFRYSLLCHDGPVGVETIGAAYGLNDSMMVSRVVDVAGAGCKGPRVGVCESLVSVSRPDVVVETVKRAEDSKDVIVRFYESLRRRGPVTLTMSFDLARAEKVNLLEEQGEALTVEGRCVTLPLGPYEIVTLKLTPK